MKTYILVGEIAINHFFNENWSELQASILMDSTGDIIAWYKEDEVSTLLDMLGGWNEFIELSQEDLKDIESNTKIEINYENADATILT